MQKRVMLEKIAKYIEPTNKRRTVRGFTKLVEGINNFEIAFAIEYFTKVGDGVIPRLTDEERKILRSKIDYDNGLNYVDCKNFANIIYTVERNVLGLYESLNKVVTFLQSITSMWVIYEREAKIVSSIMNELTTMLKGKLDESSLNDVKAYFRNMVTLDLNTDLEQFEGKDIVEFSLGEDELLKMDCFKCEPNQARIALHLGKTYAERIMSRIKAFEESLEYIDNVAEEHGYHLPKFLMERTYETFERSKVETSNNEDFSYNVYLKAIEDGDVVKQEYMEQRFIFPDYKTVDRNEESYKFHCKLLNIWQ